ncbi:head-tail adaptor protein [Ochrobactrum haematophilum]|uniref:Head-tail adaptor protein n=1 Tax=Brucella haematophila TaxID=419474 RepID=A0ABX1DMB6_9HYPH|nr:head-tail adaptor protein [Brucella haematophila]
MADTKFRADAIGQLNARITFAKRVEIDDGFGGTRGEWQDQFTVPARLKPKFGGNAESLVASRLVSKQPYNLTIYSSTRRDRSPRHGAPMTLGRARPAKTPIAFLASKPSLIPTRRTGFSKCWLSRMRSPDGGSCEA